MPKANSPTFVDFTVCSSLLAGLAAAGFFVSVGFLSMVQMKLGDKITKSWGGTFHFEMGTPWKRAVREWKAKGGIVVHLTAYGENIQTSDILNRIKALNKDLLLIVGSQKVPGEFYSNQISDFNVSIGNQPHSECSALAIFLDHFFEGKELAAGFDKAKIEIIPQERGKKTKVYDEKV